jgi:hypothetical protein
MHRTTQKLRKALLITDVSKKPTAFSFQDRGFLEQIFLELLDLNNKQNADEKSDLKYRVLLFTLLYRYVSIILLRSSSEEMCEHRKLFHRKSCAVAVNSSEGIKSKINNSSLN